MIHGFSSKWRLFLRWPAILALLVTVTIMSVASAAAANTVITFDDPNGVYVQGDAVEKGFRVWETEPDGWKFFYSSFYPQAFPGPAPDSDIEINLGNNGRTIQLAAVDNSPFTLVSFFTSALCCNNTAGVTVRGFNAANVQVASIVISDRYPGGQYTLPASFSNVKRVTFQSSGGGSQGNHSLDNITILGASDTTAPVVTAPAPLTVECSTTGGTPTSNAAIQAWLASASATDNVDGSVAVSNNLVSGLCAVGTTTTVTFSATDAAGNAGSATSTITVVDTAAPTITDVAVSKAMLWPANHKMVPVSLSVDASDVCDPSVTCEITSVTSNEPVDGLGDGDTSPDWVITGALTLELRAERSGTGTGRVYTITVTCTDDSGNASTKTVDVTVPHSMGKDS